MRIFYSLRSISPSTNIWFYYYSSLPTTRSFYHFLSFLWFVSLIQHPLEASDSFFVNFNGHWMQYFVRTPLEMYRKTRGLQEWKKQNSPLYPWINLTPAKALPLVPNTLFYFSHKHIPFLIMQTLFMRKFPS